jgi:signal transduction histidine kinase
LGGEIRDIQVIGHPVLSPSGDVVEFVGTMMDVTERRRAEEERQALAHANRIATMGQLTASIAHEVNQPIAAAITNAQATLRWLSAARPDLEEARQALRRIVENGNRAGEVIGRIRALITKAPPRKDDVAINDAILEVVALTHGEAVKVFRAIILCEASIVRAGEAQLPESRTVGAQLVGDQQLRRPKGRETGGRSRHRDGRGTASSLRSPRARTVRRLPGPLP